MNLTLTQSKKNKTLRLGQKDRIQIYSKLTSKKKKERKRNEKFLEKKKQINHRKKTWSSPCSRVSIIAFHKLSNYLKVRRELPKSGKDKFSFIFFFE